MNELDRLIEDAKHYAEAARDALKHNDKQKAKLFTNQLCTTLAHAKELFNKELAKQGKKS